MTEERLQKILARAGVAARRKAEALISEGRVAVNGRVVTELGTKADPRRDKVTVDDRPVTFDRPCYHVFHKPRGMVTTMDDPEGRPSVGEIARRLGSGVFPVGRLDFNTSGVLLLTNDGELAQTLAHPRYEVPRVYHLKVRGVVTPEILDLWRKGIALDPGELARADVFVLEKDETGAWLEAGLRQGLNRQILRMAEATGLSVVKLKRVSFAGITLGGLKVGEVRPLSGTEVARIKRFGQAPQLKRKKDGVLRSDEVQAKSGTAARAAQRMGAASRSAPVRPLGEYHGEVPRRARPGRGRAADRPAADRPRPDRPFNDRHRSGRPVSGHASGDRPEAPPPRRRRKVTR